MNSEEKQQDCKHEYTYIHTPGGKVINKICRDCGELIGTKIIGEDSWIQ